MVAAISIGATCENKFFLEIVSFFRTFQRNIPIFIKFLEFSSFLQTCCFLTQNFFDVTNERPTSWGWDCLSMSMRT